MKHKRIAVVVWSIFFAVAGHTQNATGRAAANGFARQAQTPPIVYVSTAGGGITEVNAANNSIIATAPFPNNANSVAVTPDGTRMYATNRDLGKVTVFDTTTNVPLADIAVGNGSDNLGLAISPDGQLVLVANQFSGTVTAISTATNAILKAIPTGVEPIWIAFSPDGSRAYVSNQGSGTLSVIATGSLSVIGTVTGFSCPFESAFTRDSRLLYVSSQCDNSVKVVDPVTNSLVNSIPTGPNPRGIAFSQDGTRAYVADFFSNTVDVLDAGAQINLGRPIMVGNNPWGLAITPDNKIYVANFGDGTISEIDAAVNETTATLPSLANPEDVTISTTANPRILQYSFTTIDVPEAIGTQPTAINDRGTVVGFYTDSAGVIHGFVRSRTGDFTTIDRANAVFTVVEGINSQDVAVGWYQDAETGALHGFQRDPGGQIRIVDMPGVPDSTLFGINANGDAVGNIDLGDQTTEIGILVHLGVFTTFEDPNAAPMMTQASGINETGLITGFFIDPQENSHGFLLKDTEFTTLDFPGAANTFANNTNDYGTTVGSYDAHGYLLDQQFLSFDFPDSHVTRLRGINNQGGVVGFYRSVPGGPLRGFMAVPGAY